MLINDVSHPADGPPQTTHWLNISFEMISTLLPLIDLSIILGASYIGAIAANLISLPSPIDTTSLFGLALVASGFYVFRIRETGFYEVQRLRLKNFELPLILQTWIITSIVIVSLIFLFKLHYMTPRSAVLAFLVLGFAGLFIWRATIKYLVRWAIAQGVVGKAQGLMIIGERDEIRSEEFAAFLSYGGVANATKAEIDWNKAEELEPAQMNHMLSWAKQHNVSEVLLAVKWNNTAKIDALSEQLRSLPAAVRLLPDSQMRKIADFSSIGMAQFIPIDLQRAPMLPFDRGLKRASDIILATAALILFSPVMLMAALAIKLDSRGPIIFRQARSGFNDRKFMIFKFRTMNVQEDGEHARQAVCNDPRVTRAGRFLRATSIDELPQLINVLIGHMSLVGPRPHAINHDTEFQRMLADYAHRRHVKPGITGWAQCRGKRGPTESVKEIQDRVELDLWYINNWSFWLDLLILFRTSFVLFGQKNAL